jgi:hypothetical protein
LEPEHERDHGDREKAVDLGHINLADLGRRGVQDAEAG